MPGHGVGGPEMSPSDALGGKKGFLFVCLFFLFRRVGYSVITPAI